MTTAAGFSFEDGGNRSRQNWSAEKTAKRDGGSRKIFGGYAVLVSASVSVLGACDDEKGAVPS